jgi:hypothetical protein
MKKSPHTECRVVGIGGANTVLLSTYALAGCYNAMVIVPQVYLVGFGSPDLFEEQGSRDTLPGRIGSH